MRKLDYKFIVKEAIRSLTYIMIPLYTFTLFMTDPVLFQTYRHDPRGLFSVLFGFGVGVWIVFDIFVMRLILDDWKQKTIPAKTAIDT